MSIHTVSNKLQYDCCLYLLSMFQSKTYLAVTEFFAGVHETLYII